MAREERRGENKRGRRKKRRREKQTHYCLKGNKGDLSSQSFTVCMEAMGDPHCVCVLVTVQHTTIYWNEQCMCVSMHVYVAPLFGHLSIENNQSTPWNVGRWRARLGPGPTFHTRASWGISED